MKYSNLLKNCNLCIRRCNIDRINGEIGFCRATDRVKIARASLHMWEEPPISGDVGSGTVFFSNCNLKCVFCQNHEISQESVGIDITIERLADIFLELQDKNAANINLVTPTHYVPHIIEAIDIARAKGLSIPILYNTNSYDSVETIKLLKGYIDVYLPDFKYFNDKYAIKYSNAPRYEENIIPVLKEMYNQVGPVQFDNNGFITKGIIIRHLMLPGLLFDSKKILDKIYSVFQDNVYISIMNQYTPMFNASKYPEIDKSLNPKHYDALIDYASSIGITKGFIQESGTNSTAYVPNFNFEGI